MKYLLHLNGAFWTGDRFTDHIGEAQRYTYAEVRGARLALGQRLSILPHIVEAPPNDGNDPAEA